jgi:tetratricopeptide (TPR) repeat protein
MPPSVDLPKRIALVIGALTGEELTAGNRDVARVYSLLTDPELGDCSSSSPKPILECATRDEFHKALASALEDWRGVDQLVLYFTGHGRVVGGTYCLQVGSAVDDLLPFDNLLNDLRIRGVRRAILILDTCYSGAAAKVKSSRALPLLEEYQLPKGIAIVASSRASETSLELSDGSSSVFTHLFCLGIEKGLEGIGTSDGYITVEDIVNFVNSKLQSDSDYADYLQRPIYKVEEADSAIWISKNRSGIRPGEDKTHPKNTVSSLEELQFLYENTQPSKHPCPNATIQDLDWTLVEEFAQKVYPELAQDASKEVILSDLKLYSPIPYQGHPTLHKAAVLCFAQRPDLFYEQAKSVFVVGNPRDKNFIREDVTGPLSRQVARLVKKVDEHLNTISCIGKDGLRRERLEIELDVVRELISNAITHRDYDSNGAVTVMLTSHALEVRSPGVFPSETSWSAFLHSEKPVSCPVNVAISHYLANLLAFEGIGRGFDVFKQYLRRNGNESIAYDELPGAITVIRVLRRTSQSPASKRPLQRPPRVKHFINRKQELEELLRELQPGRVVTICGPGGIGKTALAAELVWKLTPANKPPERFPDGIVFHSFYDQPQARVALESIALAFDEEPRPTPALAAQRALAKKRALLVLDGAENADDLPSVLDVAGNCAVLVTSRARKDALEERQDLHPLALNEAVSLLQAWGSVSGEDEIASRRICELVGGLPLALRLVGRYLAETGERAAEYLKWLEATPLEALDHGQRQLESVLLLLEQSLAQVSAQARQVLAVIGVLAPAPFSPEPAAAALDMTRDDFRRSLGQLVSYSLLVRSGERYEVGHPLIHTYARTQLDVSSEAVSRLTDYFTSLTETETQKGVEGYQHLDDERAHILRVLSACADQGDWERVLRLVWVVESYLDLRGYTTDLVAVLQMGIAATRKKNNRKAESKLLTRVGLAHHDLGHVEQAIECFEQGLMISREIGDREGEGDHLGNLGRVYGNLGQVEQAIEYYQQALVIAQETGDRHGQGARSGELGVAYRALGEVKLAVSHYEQALTIAREIDDRRNEGVWLGNLGNAYRDLGQTHRAIEFYEQALAIAQDIGDRRAEGTSLGNLGNAYKDLGQAEEAVEYYKRSLTVTQGTGDRRNEGIWLSNLGEAYQSTGQMDKAIASYEQAVAIAQEVGDQRSEGIRQGNLGNAYYSVGQVEQAMTCYKHALAIAQGRGNRGREGAFLGNLGIASSTLGQTKQATVYYRQALAIAREIGDRHSEGVWLSNLGNAYYSLGQMDKAIAHYEQALAIAREIGDRRNQGAWLSNLGNAHHSIGQVGEAIGYYEEALNIARKIGDRRGEGAGLGNLGNIHYSMKQLDEAIQYYEQALSISRGIGDRRNEAAWLDNLGGAYSRLGRTKDARLYFQQALTTFEAIGSPYADCVREQLSELDAQT